MVMKCLVEVCSYWSEERALSIQSKTLSFYTHNEWPLTPTLPVPPGDSRLALNHPVLIICFHTHAFQHPHTQFIDRKKLFEACEGFVGLPLGAGWFHSPSQRWRQPSWLGTRSKCWHVLLHETLCQQCEWREEGRWRLLLLKSPKKINWSQQKPHASNSFATKVVYKVLACMRRHLIRSWVRDKNYDPVHSVQNPYLLLFL